MKYLPRAHFTLSLLIGLLAPTAIQADDTWWSRQAMTLPAVPPANQWCRNEVDYFVRKG
jgi:hypothetical protein